MTFFSVSGGEETKPLLIGLICAGFSIPIALYVIYIVIKYMAMKDAATAQKVPKVLVIHSSSVALHANVVLCLVDYLKNHCSIEPLVDELHIFSSKSRVRAWIVCDYLLSLWLP